ncbi:uncharacterized protein LOC110396135 isoform X2 [Numida meleagris]|uniref:uncharacterized protein LOC110396135 isoform X2 n=1 Tax=Numida meleagris TaxID=8996 RepID=UPI000B3E165D|nr:uncharacterized protein LOC110396135 isoform X2 [Numida meleagris]
MWRLLCPSNWDAALRGTFLHGCSLCIQEGPAAPCGAPQGLHIHRGQPAPNWQHSYTCTAFYYRLLTSTGYGMNYFRGPLSEDKEQAWLGEAFSGGLHGGLHDTPGPSMHCRMYRLLEVAQCPLLAIFPVLLCFYGKTLSSVCKMEMIRDSLLWKGSMFSQEDHSQCLHQNPLVYNLFAEKTKTLNNFLMANKSKENVDDSECCKDNYKNYIQQALRNNGCFSWGVDQVIRSTEKEDTVLPQTENLAAEWMDRAEAWDRVLQPPLSTARYRQGITSGEGRSQLQLCTLRNPADL